MGYTRMLADYAGISSEATYYVPDGCAYEVWALRGQGQRAYTYFAENAPAAQNDRAEVRHLEPYCYGQFTEGPASKHFGRSQVHWLTGTASTVMVGCVEGILGCALTWMGCAWHRPSPANGRALQWTRISAAAGCTSGWRISTTAKAALPA